MYLDCKVEPPKRDACNPGSECCPCLTHGNSVSGIKKISLVVLEVVLSVTNADHSVQMHMAVSYTEQLHCDTILLYILFQDID